VAQATEEERATLKKIVIFATMCAALALTAAAAASAPPLDELWLQTSISGDRFEVAGGKLALAKGTSPKVKALGARLVRDHSKSLVESITLAKQLGVRVPPSATPSMQWELQQLKTLSGAAFDRAYVSLEVLDHEQDVEETATEVLKGSSPRVRAAAKHELPMLNMHLRLSKAAR
jgi:putative membrane protein